MYKSILVATDGSELAGRAVCHGIGLAKTTGARLVFVTVTELWSALDMAGEFDDGDLDAIKRYEDAASRSAGDILRKCAELAEKEGVPSSTLHVADRDPADGILESAEKEDCDLIVMATHGRRGVRKALLGSQTAEVLSESKRPVLVLR